MTCCPAAPARGFLPAAPKRLPRKSAPKGDEAPVLEVGAVISDPSSPPSDEMMLPEAAAPPGLTAELELPRVLVAGPVVVSPKVVLGRDPPKPVVRVLTPGDGAGTEMGRLIGASDWMGCTGAV